MAQRILILDGHPDPSAERFVHALADAYRQGAESNRHEVMLLRVADLDFPLLRTQADYEKGDPSEAIRRCQGLMDWATYVVILYPLWLGSMPAMLKALLEQILRPGFAFSARKLGRWPVKLQFDAGRLLQARRTCDQGNDLWSVYNKVQENVIVGGIEGRTAHGRRTMSRRINSIDEDLRINLALWQEAMALIRP